MTSSASDRPPAKEGTVSTRRRADTVMFTEIKGYISADVARQMEKDFFDAMNAADAKPRFWLIDALEVSGYAAEIGQIGSGMFARFRREGGIVLAVIVTDMAVRMIVQTIAFSSGQRVKFAKTLAEGEKKIRAAIEKHGIS